MSSISNKTVSRRIEKLVQLALEEDLGTPFCDLTSAWTLPKNLRGTALVEAQAHGVLSGAVPADRVYRLLAKRLRKRVQIKWSKQEGQSLEPGHIIAEINGPMQLLLMGERCALNFLQNLSGIATTTSGYVQEARGTRAKILDTRKTIPGFRDLAKRAVVHGGGHNHRQGLYDEVLIKDNHGDAGKGAAEAVRMVLSRKPRVKVQVEVRNRREFDECLAAGACSLLLDNMTPAQIKKLVALRPRGVELEASGSITLKNVAAYARTGIDRISIGALTHTVQALSMHMILKSK